MPNTSVLKQRNYTQDFIRALAIFMVVLLHISAYFMGDNWRQTNGQFWTGTIFDAFTRVCVPLFVLSSGFFLIKENVEKVEVFFKKRTNKLLAPLVFWGLLYSEYSHDWHASLSQISWSFLSGRPYYHFWFLFMLIGLYMVTPFINVLYNYYGLKKMNLLGLGLLALGMVVNLWNIRFGDPSLFVLWFIPYLGYFILGHTLPQMNYNFSRGVALTIYVAASLGLIVAAYFALIKTGNSEYAFDYLSPLVIVASLSFYLFLVSFSLKESWITHIAPFTLGIYLIHILFMEKLFDLTHMTIFGNGGADILALTLPVFLLSWFSVWLISKVPVLQRVI